MKVLLVNDSPNKEGRAFTALSEVAGTLNQEGVETEFFWVGNKPVGGCVARRRCGEKRERIFYDAVNEFRLKAFKADGFVFGTPVRYASASGNMIGFMDRLFYSELRDNANRAFRLKPAAAVISARRAGTTSTFDQMIKYFTIQEMPVVSTRYWNMVHGAKSEDVLQDAEGVFAMRELGQNMAFLPRCLEAGKKPGVTRPVQEAKPFTNFIR
ncbi:MAG: flavodoxin family protein [Deltaproteobacteria bacterium]|nr:flavodoxin family protein [Deltaproteobacteria bacterium]